jgi:hypothetical protein
MRIARDAVVLASRGYILLESFGICEFIPFFPSH